MRGSFIHTLKVKYGSRSVTGPPGVVFASDIPCRYVVQHDIDQLQFPLTLANAWVTLDAFVLDGPHATTPFDGGVFTDYFAADEVQVSAAPGVWYTVVRGELVDPISHADYWRYMLIPTSFIHPPVWPPPVSPPPPPGPPIPPPPPPGGTCADAGVVAYGETVDQFYSAGDVVDQWWRLPDVLAATTMHVTRTSVVAGLSIHYLIGTCPTLFDISDLSNVGCSAFTAGDDHQVYIRVTGTATTYGMVGFVADVDACP